MGDAKYDTTWINRKHSPWYSAVLTANDPQAENPAEFTGNLFTPQRTILAAMLALEDRPLLHQAANSYMQTKIGRISEKFSFGKTVVTLALICKSQTPRMLPEILPLLSPRSGGDNRARVSQHSFSARKNVFLPDITVRYNRFLPFTVVIAATNIITQWEENTVKFTNLKYFTIENVRKLREFEKMYRSGEIREYDIIFVKAGRVTAKFVVDGEPAHNGKKTNRSLIGSINKILEGVPVSRVIIDDYDTLNLHGDDCYIPSLFTWLVSATRRKTTARATLPYHATTVEEFFRCATADKFPVLGAALNDMINGAFSLSCDAKYVDQHINSFKVNYRKIYVRGGQAAEILRNLGVPEDVIEMVNADAVGTAANALGISASSAGDVIQRVVGNHLEKMRGAMRAIVRIGEAEDYLNTSVVPGVGAKLYNMVPLQNAIKSGTDEEFSAVLHVGPRMTEAMQNSLVILHRWAVKLRNTHSTALNRMRDNIREGYCQCCQVPFDDEDDGAAYVLSGCCQIIVCESCITKQERDRKAIIDRCPNCAKAIKIPSGLVRVGPEIDLSSALSDESVIAAIDAKLELDQKLEPLGASTALFDELDNPKLKALIQYIMGSGATLPGGGLVGPIDCIKNEVTQPYIARLLDGRKDTPWPEDKQRKYLVFTMHSESTRMVSRALDKFAITHCILRGSRAQKDAVVREIQHSNTNIILVSSPKDCGGLNMPFISNIIFYHRVISADVEAQVAGRGQRLGRTHNMEIMTILNEAEVDDE